MSGKLGALLWSGSGIAPGDLASDLLCWLSSPVGGVHRCFPSLSSGSRGNEEKERLPVGSEERRQKAPPPAHGRTWKLHQTLQLCPASCPCAPSPSCSGPLAYSLLGMDGEGLGNGGPCNTRSKEAWRRNAQSTQGISSVLGATSQPAKESGHSERLPGGCLTLVISGHCPPRSTEKDTEAETRLEPVRRQLGSVLGDRGVALSKTPRGLSPVGVSFKATASGPGGTSHLAGSHGAGRSSKTSPCTSRAGRSCAS